VFRLRRVALLEPDLNLAREMTTFLWRAMRRSSQDSTRLSHQRTR